MQSTSARGKGRSGSRFGTYLRQKRREAGLSQSRLAEALGVTNTYIHLLETGRADAPTEPRCDQLAEALDLDVAEVRELARKERLARYVERQGWSDGGEPVGGSEGELTEQERALIRLVRSLDPDTRKDFEGMVYMLLRHRDEAEIRENLDQYVGDRSPVRGRSRGRARKASR